MFIPLDSSLIPRLPSRALAKINRESASVYFCECTWGEPGNEARAIKSWGVESGNEAMQVPLRTIKLG